MAAFSRFWRAGLVGGLALVHVCLVDVSLVQGSQGSIRNGYRHSSGIKDGEPSQRGQGVTGTASDGGGAANPPAGGSAGIDDEDDLDGVEGGGVDMYDLASGEGQLEDLGGGILDQEGEADEDEADEGTTGEGGVGSAGHARRLSEGVSDLGNLVERASSALKAHFGGDLEESVKPPSAPSSGSIVEVQEAARKAGEAAAVLGEAATRFLKNVGTLLAKSAQIPADEASKAAGVVMEKIGESAEQVGQATDQFSAKLASSVQQWTESLLVQLAREHPSMLVHALELQKKLQGVHEEMKEFGEQIVEDAAAAAASASQAAGSAASFAVEKASSFYQPKTE